MRMIKAGTCRKNCLCHRYCHSSIVGSQIGKFGSILKYYQEMLAYLAPYCSGIYCWDIQPSGQWARSLFSA